MVRVTLGDKSGSWRHVTVHTDAGMVMTTVDAKGEVMENTRFYPSKETWEAIAAKLEEDNQHDGT